MFDTNLRREIAEPSSGDRHTVFHPALRNKMRNTMRNMRNQGHDEKRGNNDTVVVTWTISPGLLYLEHNLLATLTRPKSVMIALPFSKKMFFVFKSWRRRFRNFVSND